MNCEDAHELAAASSRNIGLTELALVEAHLRQCAACREASRDHQTPPPPERAASLAVVRVRLGALRASGPALSARAGAVAGDAARHGAALFARARTALAETARAGAGALRVTPGLRARVGGLRARLAALPTPRRPAVRLVWLGVLATLAVYAGHSALRPRAPGPIGTGTDARLAPPALVESPAPSPARLDVKAAPPATIESSTPAVPERTGPAELESGVALAALSVSRPEPEVRRAPAPPAPPSTPIQKPEPARAPLSAPKRAETASPDLAPRRPPTLAHVAGQLSVKNRGVAERDLTALLARTGGSLVGTDRAGAVMFLDAVVPQSGYEEFTRGLARIGAWRVEAERSRLPEDVHLTIRVGG